MSYVDKFIKNHSPKKINIDGQEYSYLIGGVSKTAFLIFPGSGQDALSCFDLIDAFEKKYKAIAINYTGIYSLDSFFKYINAILRKEKIEKVILYGLSIGGFLAQHYVRRFSIKVTHLILSHSGTTKSKTIIKRVIIPGKIMYFLLPLIPQRFLNKIFIPIAGRVQSGQKDIISLYEKYSDKENLQRRRAFAKKSTFSMIDKKYIKSVYSLGVEMEKKEKKFTSNDLTDWKGKILILRTDNDPLAQDDGVFKLYYPNAKVVTFHKTGHLTPFIRFDEIVKEIEHFLKK